MDSLIQFLGWIGGSAYAIFAVPQAVSVIRKGNARGLNLLFILLTFAGSVLSLSYAIVHMAGPLIFNFGLNAIVFLIFLKYKFFERV